MEKVRPWCGHPLDRGRLKNTTEIRPTVDYTAAVLSRLYMGTSNINRRLAYCNCVMTVAITDATMTEKLEGTSAGGDTDNTFP